MGKRKRTGVVGTMRNAHILFMEDGEEAEVEHEVRRMNLGKGFWQFDVVTRIYATEEEE
jgi:hypothetical protein